ncbi:ATP-dependent DNA ligase Cdc17 [Entomophthora muscae]|nr:ATP-dependent DNA ligase Cdc17 [Entomophthora muscae]
MTGKAASPAKKGKKPPPQAKKEPVGAISNSDEEVSNKRLRARGKHVIQSSDEESIPEEASTEEVKMETNEGVKKPTKKPVKKAKVTVKKTTVEEISAKIESTKIEAVVENVKEEVKSEQSATVKEDTKVHSFFSNDPSEKPLFFKPKTYTIKNGLADFYISNFKKLPPFSETDSLFYKDLCDVFTSIEATTKRLEKLAILTEFFLRVLTTFPMDSETSQHIVVTALYLCINRIAPDYDGIELGIGESVLMKAVAEATGRTLAKIKADVAKVGDLGTVAQESRSTQGTLFKPKPLTILIVFKTLKEIAMMSGNSSMQRKVDKVKFLLVSCRDNEAKFLMRSLEGKLRIGLAERSVLVALAHASVLIRHKNLSKESLEEKLNQASESIKTAFSELPNYERIAPPLILHGYDALEHHCKLTPGIPVKPMLAHPTKSISEVLTRFDGITFTCEYKYDGERAQLHRLEDGSMRIYSRNSEDMTQKYPDIMGRIPSFTSESTSFVLDCEAVAWDKEERKIMPFQVLSTRKRKDVKEEDIKVQVVVFAFDLLYLNGQSLLRESFAERRAKMFSAFKEVEGVFTFAKSMVLTQVEEIQSFLDESIVDNCEGLMVKTLDGAESTYEPSKRSRNWLKVKKDYLAGIGDSLDLVVIGAYAGRGKRTGVYGGYLLACYDPDNDEYQSICKIGTGFSEQALESQYEQLKPHIISAPKPYYKYDHDSTKPDVWFEPSLVWEVKAADLSISPIYKAAYGRVDPSKGISLRFPRFIRLRDDKSPEQATACSQVAEFYNQQAVINQQTSKSAGACADDEFDY